MKNNILISFLIILLNINYSTGKNEEEIILNFLNDKVNYSGNLIIIAIDMDMCLSCADIKISSTLSKLKNAIKDTKSLVIVESNIPGDSYSIKNRFNSDYFLEDTNLIFKNYNFLFPKIILKDKINNIFFIRQDDFLNKKELNSLNNLINPSDYTPLKSHNIIENKDFYFSKVDNPIIINDILYFLELRRNQMLQYDIKKKSFKILLEPKESLLLNYSNISSYLLDSLKNNGFFNINYFFKILSWDYDFEKKSKIFLIEKLNKIDKELLNGKINLNLWFKRGIFELNRVDSMYFYEFKDKIYTTYSMLRVFKNKFIMNLDYGNEILNDTSALLISVKNKIQFDTLIFLKDLEYNKKEQLVESPVQIIKCYKEYIFILTKDKVIYIYNDTPSMQLKFQLKGILKLNDFSVSDIYIEDNLISVISTNKSRLIIQNYNLSNGELLNEKVFMINEHILNSMFINNQNRDIIILNKWLHKRWTIDFIN